jgi:tRNA A58 N-methylase Trm61
VGSNTSHHSCRESTILWGQEDMIENAYVEMLGMNMKFNRVAARPKSRCLEDKNYITFAIIKLNIQHI